MLKASLKELTAESFGENVLFRMQYHAAEWRGRFDILKRVVENTATYHADFDKELFSLAGKLRGELPYEDCQAEVRVFIEKFAGGRDHPRWANATPVELQFHSVDGSRGDEFTTFTLFNPFDRYDGPTELSQFWLQVVWKLSHLAYCGGTLHQQAKMRKQILEAARDYLDARGYQIPEATDKSEMGISLYDLAFVIEEDDSAATQRVKVWSDSKRISAESIGKCPLDGRRPLYRLSELLSDVKKLLSLNAKEVAKYRQALTAKLREPRPS
ncbi:MAG: hypothetical protein H6821_16735 [Planctomycetaceae bacterium]|nr:hypothetical protein [Planctomycetaceae bacterium]